MLNVVIRGKRFKMVSKQMPPHTDGYCQHPTTPGKEIGILKNIRSSSVLLETLVHEMVHAALFDLSEDAVTETAESIARNLTRVGVTLDVKEVHRRLARPPVAKK
jgi:hypothetical protein